MELGFSLLGVGLLGLLINGKNLILMLVSLEIILLSINIILINWGIMLDLIYSETWCLYILSVAASESAIGLALLVQYFRVRGSTGILFKQLLKG